MSKYVFLEPLPILSFLVSLFNFYLGTKVCIFCALSLFYEAVESILSFCKNYVRTLDPVFYSVSART